MKTGNPSAAGPSEGSSPSPRDEGALTNDLYSFYNKSDVTSFLDTVLTGVGTVDVEAKKVGQRLMKACGKKKYLVQLVRGVLHLVELYQAGKRLRQVKVEREVKTEAEETLKKGTIIRKTLRRAKAKRQKAQRGNIPVVHIKVEKPEEETIGTSDGSLPNQGQDEHEHDAPPSQLQGLEPQPPATQNQGNENEPPQGEEENKSNDGNSIEEEETVDGTVEGGDNNKNNNVHNNNGSNNDNTTSIFEEQDRPSRSPRLSARKRRTRVAFSPSGNNNNSAANNSNNDTTSIDLDEERPSRSPRRPARKRFARVAFSPSRNDEEDAAAGFLTLKGRGIVSQKKKKASEDVPTSSKSDVSNSEERSTRKRTQKTHKCLMCKDSFPSKGLLEVHSRVHGEGEGPFPCPRPGCPKTFHIKASVTRHLNAHGGKKPYKCVYPRCRKAFAYWTGWNSHRLVHLGPLPFSCKFSGCGKKFASKYRLTRHEGCHTRPFKCGYPRCGGTFTAKTTLTRHQQTFNHY